MASVALVVGLAEMMKAMGAMGKMACDMAITLLPKARPIGALAATRTCTNETVSSAKPNGVF